MAQNSNVADEVKKIIQFDTDINCKKVPGFIIGIIDNDSTYFLSYGSKDPITKEKITTHDAFELGSISKTFTAAIITILSHRGQLDPKQKVNTYLPKEYENPRLSDITIIDLLDHTSGFPKMPKDLGKKAKEFNNPYQYYTKHDVLKYYKSFIPKERKFEYSHTNYAILEIIIEMVTKKSFDEVLVDEINTVLNLNTTTCDGMYESAPNLAKGFDKSGKVCTPWSFSSFIGSEGIRSNLEDLLVFVKAQLGMSETYLDSIFYETNAAKVATFNDRLSISNGWHTVSMKNGDLVIHTGRTGGHNCYIGMVKETKTAVIVLSNSYYGTGDLGTLILRMINQSWKRNADQ
ncbi:MAG: serine hydrolase [Saprospiraceae bacterium]